MIVKQQDLTQKPKSEPYFRITATLLNAWQYIFDSEKYVTEKEDDTICYEDKVKAARDKAFEAFVKLLNRMPATQTEAMKLGIEYEASVYRGEDEVFSPIVEGGSFQVTITKKKVINNVRVVLYGVLDVLKMGMIYDIKRKSSFYKYGAYKSSHQHPIYFDLVPSAGKFKYLIFDGKEHHIESYVRENCEDIDQVISTFISWLIANDLFDTWCSKWAMYI